MKADLVAALKDAVAYCDKAYGGVTDASGSQTVTQEHCAANERDSHMRHRRRSNFNVIKFLRRKLFLGVFHPVERE